MTTQPKTAAPTDSAPNNAEGRIVAFRSEIHTPEAEYNANVPIDLIERDPANRVPTEAAVVAIAESIKAEGLLQPIVLRPLESGSYRLIAGEHRWRAYVLLKRETIAALIYKDESELSAARKSAIENFSREQLTPIERAKKFKQLADLGMKQKQIGALLGGLSQPVVANAMRLLSKLTDDANKNAWALPEALGAVMNMALPEVKVNVGDVVAWDYAGAGDIVGEVVSVEEYEKTNGEWLKAWSRESTPVRPTSWPKCYPYQQGFIHVHKTADLRVVRRAEPALLLDVPATPKVKKAKAAKVKAPRAKPAKAKKKGGR